MMDGEGDGMGEIWRDMKFIASQETSGFHRVEGWREIFFAGLYVESRAKPKLRLIQGGKK